MIFGALLRKPHGCGLTWIGRCTSPNCGRGTGSRRRRRRSGANGLAFGPGEALGMLRTIEASAESALIRGRIVLTCPGAHERYFLQDLPSPFPPPGLSNRRRQFADATLRPTAHPDMLSRFYARFSGVILWAVTLSFPFLAYEA